ncbi:predicted protein [Streptomyces viridosporus ATCC 14672]|uniref:Predicted protein n=1 Tax=Streptomyces viridosporus (strain ATCC 14672 / DSM 40746 / JCM 4963 / KCTC 9882 / NRRL B-12104 / FH 1290) TaxID=566461 RepID=D6A0K1_STRV1|nr:predicted protein [Streptomyces viridosporus ATCC 14672]
MNYRLWNLRRHRIIFAFMVCVPVTFLAGCDIGEKVRSYTTPHSLCGIKVDPEELAPFLPPGEKIKVRKEPHSGSTTCKVVVDDTLTLTTTQEWLRKGKSTVYFASGQTLEDIKFSTEDGRFRYSGNEGFGKTRECVDEFYEQELYTALQASGSKHKDPEAMKDLIVSYTDEVEKSPECTATAL